MVARESMKMAMLGTRFPRLSRGCSGKGFPVEVDVGISVLDMERFSPYRDPGP